MTTPAAAALEAPVPTALPAATAAAAIVGRSPALREALERLERIATSELPVLITGETGTGKELFARLIHESSSRRGGPFVSENCAAVAEGVLELELFGSERGAFTDATRDREGLFLRASGGTLFVDEVGDMPASMQAKLLRVLEEGEVRKIGGAAPESVDVRVIAATHRDLPALAREGRFRQDLLFRLHVLEVRAPSLRERREDIPLLAERFLEKLAESSGSPALVLSDEGLDALLAHDWPGNVRELENAIRAAALFSPGPALEAGALPIPTARARASGALVDALFERGLDARLGYTEVRAALDERERRYLRAVLDEVSGNKARAARKLGLTRYALYRVMRRLAMDRG